MKDNKKSPSTKKYITLKDGGTDFRTMAMIMSKHGFKMNHATARNQLNLAVKYLLTQISSSLKSGARSVQLEELMGDQEIHENLSDIIYLAFTEERKSNEKQ